jgi:hypothetical protein
VLGASSKTNGFQGPKSSRNTQYIDKKDKEAKKLRSQKILTGDDARSRPDDPLACIGWKPKERKREESQKLNLTRHFTKEEYLQKHNSSD